MKDLIYNFVSLTLGLVIGVLTTILSVVALGLYIWYGEDKKKDKKGNKWKRPSHRQSYFAPEETKESI